MVITNRGVPGGVVTHRGPQTGGVDLPNHAPACPGCQQPMAWQHTKITIADGEACSVATYVCRACPAVLDVPSEQ